MSDPTGAVVTKASVTATSLSTGEKRTVTTDGQGNYQILSLPRGEYSVAIDAQGFKHFSRSSIDVVVDQVARVDVAMIIGEQNQPSRSYFGPLIVLLPLQPVALGTDTLSSFDARQHLVVSYRYPCPWANGICPTFPELVTQFSAGGDWRASRPSKKVFRSVFRM